MKNNKGYSLVELLLTLFIFSVIMVSIIAIMRTSLVSYRNGLAETKIQEDAQIVINQMSNILVDASSFTADASGDVVKWPMTFTHPTYGTVKINYNSATGELSLNDDLLATNVKDFDVLELHKTADLTTEPVDNSAVIKLTLDDGNGGHEYTVQKVVFFRNNVENEDNLMYDVSNAEDSASPTPTVSGAKVAVLRYGSVDLTKQFGIVSDAALSTQAQLNYKLNKTSTGYTGTSHKTETPILLSCGATLLGDFNKKVEAKDTTESDSSYVSGKDKNGNVVKVILYTEKVEFDDSIGVIEMKYAETNNNGVHTAVPVKGLDVYQGIKAGTLQITYNTTFKKGTNVEGTRSDTMGTSSSSSIGTIGNQINLSSGGRIMIGLCADQNSNGIMISTANDKLADTASWLKNDAGDQKLIFEMGIKGKTSSGGSFTDMGNYKIEYYYYAMGSSLKNAS